MLFSTSNTQCLAAQSDVRNLDKPSRLIRSLLTLCVICTSVFAGEQKLIKISTQKNDGRTTFQIENLQDADVTVTVELELKNLAASSEVPFTATIPARTKIEALTLRPIEEKQDSSWSYTYFATWGNLDVQHEDSYMYALPYAHGESFPVSQGFHGKYSHTGGDCFSIDFKMPEGSTVNAARDEVVVPRG